MRKKVKFLIIIAILFFTLFPLIFLGGYGLRSYKILQTKNAEETITIKKNDIIKDISLNIDTVCKEVLDISNLIVNGELQSNLNLEFVNEDGIYDYLIYKEGEIKSFKKRKYDVLEVEKNIESQFFTEDSITGYYKDEIGSRVSVFTRVYDSNLEKYAYGLLILENDFFQKFISRSEEFDIYIIDGEFRVMTSTVKEAIDNNIIDAASKAMVDGEESIRVEDGKRIAYDFINFDEADIYLRIEKDISKERSAFRNYIIMFFMISILIEAFAFLFAWKLIRIMDREIVRSHLKSKNKNVKDLMDKLDETVLWIDDVVNHYDELNLLKDDIIEIRNSLPKDSDKYEEEDKENN